MFTETICDAVHNFSSQGCMLNLIETKIPKIFFRRGAGTSCTISCKECTSHASKTSTYCQEITSHLLLSITAAVNENLERSLNSIGPLKLLKSTNHISQLADTNISDKFDYQNSSPRLIINVNLRFMAEARSLRISVHLP